MEPEPEAEPRLEAESEPEPEPELEPEPEPELEAEPEPALEAEPEPEPELEAESEPELEAESEPELEAESEPELEADPELEAEPEPFPRVSVFPVDSEPDDDPSSAGDYFEDDEQTAVTSVPEPVRLALANMDAERSARDSAAAGYSLASPPEVEHVPAPDVVAEAFSGLRSAASTKAMSLDEDVPLWAGIKGVTGDASRDDELGSGKWEEEARPLDELRKQMGATPVRPMEEIDPSRGNWPMLVVAVGALVGLIVLWFLTQGNV
jgi:hypothetical protein